MFFSTINRLRGKYANLGIALAFANDDRITVVVTPTLKANVVEAAPHLASPFMVKGTAEELDAGFTDAFERFATTLKSLEAQTQAQIDDMASRASKAAEAKKATKTVVAGANTRSNAAQLANLISTGTQPAADDDDDDGATPTSSAPPAGPLSAATLFD